MKRFLFLFLCSLCFSFSIEAQTNRSIDGSGNNIGNPNWGKAHSPFSRVVSNGYDDGISAPGGTDRPNPRDISNMISSQDQFIPNEKGLSDFIWGWGQFIDHDVALNDDHPTEFISIIVPDCDEAFDPDCMGGVEIPMRRSFYDVNSGTSPANPRMHINELTAYIDGSGVYGIDIDRVNWLRTFEGGKMKTSAGNLLPFNTVDGEYDSAVDPNAPFMLLEGPVLSKYYIGGDVRVNEQPGLTCFHTLLVREHNRLCDEIAIDHPAWSDEQIFQFARKMVGAYIQVITYKEFLPAMGIEMDPYTGYNPNVEPMIMNSFTAAGYRFGHTMVNGRLIRFEENGDVFSFGSVDLRDAFFNPEIVLNEGGIEPFFRGMAAQEHQLVDVKIMNDLRNFLFGPPGYGGLDLLSLNINRARERGLPDYNTLRQDLGLSAFTNFSDITSDTDLATTLQTVYGDVNSIDPWIGFMSEDHMTDKTVGEGMHEILSIQFQALRDGDRYYYENDPSFTADQVQAIQNTRLSDIILRNTSIDLIQDNVFLAQERNTLAVELLPFEGVPTVNLEAWPNPVQRYFSLKIRAYKNFSATLTIIDNSGRTVKEQTLEVVNGENVFEFELDEVLASGLYTILVQAEEGVGQLKIVKTK